MYAIAETVSRSACRALPLHLLIFDQCHSIFFSIIESESHWQWKPDSYLYIITSPFVTNYFHSRPCRTQRSPCFPCRSWCLWTSIRAGLNCWSPGGRSSWTTWWSWCSWHLSWLVLSSCPGTEWCAFPWIHFSLQMLAIAVPQLAGMWHRLHLQSSQPMIHTTSAQVFSLQPGVDAHIWFTSSMFTLARYCTSSLGHWKRCNRWNQLKYWPLSSLKQL